MELSGIGLAGLAGAVLNMRQDRQQIILDIIGSRAVATQQELTAELERRGIQSTQSSVSRDIAKLGLIKINGAYAAPGTKAVAGGPIVNIDTAGDHLIVVKTEVGQAQHAALLIDWANVAEIVGTVAGDDTILVAVKNAAGQRMAIKKVLGLFIGPSSRTAQQDRPTPARSGGRSKPRKRAWV